MDDLLPQLFIGGEAADVLAGVARNAAQAAAGEEPHRLRQALLDVARGLQVLLEPPPAACKLEFIEERPGHLPGWTESVYVLHGPAPEDLGTFTWPPRDEA